ncbi:helix-turn-helix domain-containing protein [Streptacidiphilus jiangxiensis]|uniref:Helix-turn-helix domain-containing protein n=1 Tax=Streptacidiphilus jiangxiensis TaxID=235985 RepID=A0A1H8BFL1_STRJI|nr:helix-turn-helix transcriptional regulator [Streptacidiphilus jiangxiensis]SEM80657.1 Helix-turn-helix domain-containing protein [Streptacidiphilus jiangxiensis]
MGSRGIAYFDPAALREQRTHAGLSQDQLAERVRARSAVVLLRTHVSMYECGRRLPEQRTLSAMADGLEVPVSCLLYPDPLSISRLRLAAKVTQSESARRMGTTQSRMSLIERGLVELDAAEVRQLAGILGTTVQAVRLAIGTALRSASDRPVATV